MDISTIGFQEQERYEEEVLKKIRNNEDFTTEEYESLFYMLKEVDEKRYDKHRWYTPIDTIFKVKMVSLFCKNNKEKSTFSCAIMLKYIA